MTLVRHGQATPFEDDTDRLSDLGERQALALGRWWLSRGASFTEVWHGSLTRQRRTAELVAGVFHAAGEPFPEPREDERLNEYAAEGILAHLAPRLSLANPEFRALMQAAQEAAHTPERNRHFQRMLEALMHHWIGADDVPEQVESWRHFSARTRGAFMDLLRAPGSARRVAVFTSGGVIGRAVQLALSAPDETALALNWRVKNASLTDFTFGAGRLSLDTFNVTEHLWDGQLDSFR